MKSNSTNIGNEKKITSHISIKFDHQLLKCQ